MVTSTTYTSPTGKCVAKLEFSFLSKATLLNNCVHDEHSISTSESDLTSVIVQVSLQPVTSTTSSSTSTGEDNVEIDYDIKMQPSMSS